MGLSLSAGKCTSENRLDGMTAIITGANSGIGKYTALDFYKRGCRVIMACRNIEKAENAAEEIRESLKHASNTGTLLVKKLDLSSIKSIKEFVKNVLKEESKVNLLVNNAAAGFCSKSYTEDGFELVFGTNHLGHFLLTYLLIPKLIESGPSRIVVVSSIGHRVGLIDFDNLNSEKSYNKLWAYCNSKLANVLFVKELARRLEGSQVNVYGVHPGLVRTEVLSRAWEVLRIPGPKFLYEWMAMFALKSPEQGAQTTIYCSIDDKAGKESGLYYENCEVTEPSAKAMDAEVAKKLWEVSCDLLKLKRFDPFIKGKGKGSV